MTVSKSMQGISRAILNVIPAKAGIQVPHRRQQRPQNTEQTP